MKTLGLLAALLVLCAGATFAHGDNDHVRGVVTAITPQAVTVQTTDKATKVLALSAKTTFEMSGKPAKLADLKVGDRVIVDVPKKTSDAALIKFGAAAPAASHAEHGDHAEHGEHKH